jgi:hypothetical protein
MKTSADAAVVKVDGLRMRYGSNDVLRDVGHGLPGGERSSTPVCRNVT